jgi:hypothetical protein
LPINPWILLRVVSAFLPVALLVSDVPALVRLLRSRLPNRASQNLKIEQQVFAVTIRAQAAAALLGINWLFSGLLVDRIHSLIRGAMCGYGVVHSHPYGPASLGTTSACALMTAAMVSWLRLEQKRPYSSFPRATAFLALSVLLLGIIDGALAFTFLAGLDMETVASCCASASDGGGDAGPLLDAPRGMPLRSLAYGLPLLVLASYSWLKRKKPTTIGSTGLLALAAVAAFGAFGLIQDSLSPHLFSSSRHVCSYCLLRPEAYWVGYVAFGMVYYAIFCFGGVGIELTLRRLVRLDESSGNGRSDEVGEKRGESSLAIAAELTKLLGRGSAAGLLVVVLVVAVVVQYLAVSGWVIL